MAQRRTTTTIKEEQDRISQPARKSLSYPEVQRHIIKTNRIHRENTKSNPNTISPINSLSKHKNCPHHNQSHLHSAMCKNQNFLYHMQNRALPLVSPTVLSHPYTNRLSNPIYTVAKHHWPSNLRLMNTQSRSKKHQNHHMDKSLITDPSISQTVSKQPPLTSFTKTKILLPTITSHGRRKGHTGETETTSRSEYAAASSHNRRSWAWQSRSTTSIFVESAEPTHRPAGHERTAQKVATTKGQKQGQPKVRYAKNRVETAVMDKIMG